MKRFVATALAATLLPLAIHAQGTVNFSSASAFMRVLDRQTGLPVGAGYTAALYWGVLGATEAQLVQIGASYPVGTSNPAVSAGFIVNGGKRTTGAATAPGTPATFQVRAWYGSFATYELAATADAVVGKGALFDNPTIDPASVPFGENATLSGWTSPVLVGIPEPSTIALAALGFGGLALIRRRK